jgi:hypothetical protein
MSLANVGGADRVIRIIVGIVLIAAPYFTTMAIWENPTARIVIPLIGGVLLLTGLFRFCALYKIFGINTGD